MKNRKASFFLVFILVFGLLLSACSSTKNESSSNTSNEGKDTATTDSKDKEVTLVYAHGKDATKATSEMIKAFEAAHPNIHIKDQEEPRDTGKQHDTYVTSFNAKSDAIDVFNLDVVWPAEFAQAGYTLPLDRFIQKDGVDTSMYNQGALSAAQYSGKQWALPLYIDAGLLFYRKDIVQDPPKTWDELIAYAKKYQGKNGTKFGYAMQAKQYEGLVCNAVEFLGSDGGGFIDKDGNVSVNTPEAIKGLKVLKEIATSDIVPSNITNFMEVDTENAFNQGQAVFARNWPYLWASSNDKEASKIAGKVGVAPLPAGDAGSASALGGWMIGINKYSKHPQEAWEFVKFMAGMEGEKLEAVYGSRAPAIMSLYDDADVLKANPFFKEQGFKDAIANATSRPVAPNYQEISNIIQIHVSKMIAGQESPEDAAKNMESEMKASMK